MQKKIIALAIAGLASTAAFAQTNVTMYGIVDIGYSYRYDSFTPGVASSSQINAGQQSGNRLGFKGTEDLGNGLKAVFLLESGFNLDTGTDHTAGSMFSRQAYAGLTGGFGTAVGGRLYSPYYSLLVSIDPFANGYVGAYSNLSNSTSGTAAGLFNPVRLDNAVAYISPSFGGFTVNGAYSNNATGADSSVATAQNNTVYSLGAGYNAGAVNVGLNYHAIAIGSNGAPTVAGTDNIKSVQNVTLAGSFDAKVVKIAAWYSGHVQDNTNRISDARMDNYMIGATIPVGKAAIKTSYTLSDGNAAAGGNAQMLAIGADYNLSKRTNLYTAWATIDNDGTRTVRRNAVVGDASGNGGSFQSGFQMGVRHQF